MSLTKAQALEMFQSDDLIGIGMEADALRRKIHPEGTVTYIIDRNINYTNFCTEYCTFCAFYRPLKGKMATEGYILDFDTIYDKIRETVELGGTGVLMQGGLHPDLKIDWHERLMRGIKERFPKIHLHCYSASEILAIAEYSEPERRRHDQAPARCRTRFHSRRRRRDPRRRSAPPHRAAEVPHRRLAAGPPHRAQARHEDDGDDDVRRRREPTSTASTTSRQLYDLQEETGGFTAFIPWSFQPKNTALGGRGWDEATAVEYLKTLAISRLYLSNFLNVQSSWVTQGLKVCQMGLRFGGNDVGSVMLEENVVKAAGTSNCTTEEELRRMISDAGFRPAQRDTLVPAVLS